MRELEARVAKLEEVIERLTGAADWRTRTVWNPEPQKRETLSLRQQQGG